MNKKQERAKRSRDAHAKLEKFNSEYHTKEQQKKETREGRIVMAFHFLVMTALVLFIMWTVIQLLAFWKVI